MAFKFRDLMIDVLPKPGAAAAPVFCPAPSGAENQVYCPSPSFLCPSPSAVRGGVQMLCPSPSAFQVRPLCANPSAAPNANLCPSPSAVQAQDALCPAPSAAAQAAGFDDTSLTEMSALREQLQKALAQVEEQETALRAGPPGADEPPKP